MNSCGWKSSSCTTIARGWASLISVNGQLGIVTGTLVSVWCEGLSEEGFLLPAYFGNCFEL